MTSDRGNRTVALVGCGRLGSAILEGWLATRTVGASNLIIVTPSEKPAAEAARALGARVNPPAEALAEVATVVLAVKPAMWRTALTPLLEPLSPEATIVSVMAGVSAEDIATVSNRSVARIMPTTAVAQARGVAALWSADPDAGGEARRLFAGVADIVELGAEAQMNAATAVAGSGPAFIHAFVQALATAGLAEGLEAEAAERLARGALRSAGAGIDSGETLDALIARIASPGGTTRAGLDAMQAGGELRRAANAAVAAAVAKAKSL